MAHLPVSSQTSQRYWRSSSQFFCSSKKLHPNVGRTVRQNNHWRPVWFHHEPRRQGLRHRRLPRRYIGVNESRWGADRRQCQPSQHSLHGQLYLPGYRRVAKRQQRKSRALQDLYIQQCQNVQGINCGQIGGKFWRGRRIWRRWIVWRWIGRDWGEEGEKRGEKRGIKIERSGAVRRWMDHRPQMIVL